MDLEVTFLLEPQNRLRISKIRMEFSLVVKGFGSKDRKLVGLL